MSWFKRTERGINTPTEMKKEAPDGLWYQCPECKTVIQTKEHAQNLYTCPSCNYHDRIGSDKYFEVLFDEGKYEELDANLSSGDPLTFVDSKAYPDRIKASQKKSGLKDAVRTGVGKIDGHDLVISCMDFAFIGGSMGSVVGEKISRPIRHSLKINIPLVMFSKSRRATIT